MEPQTNYEEHEAARLFPMMEETALQQLADDIRANGLIEPIVLHDSKILDGRNRLAACQLAGVTPRFETASLNGTLPTVWVISKNLNRRHLTISQRAAIAAEAFPLIQRDTLAKQKAAGERGKEYGKQGGRGHRKPLTANSPEGVSARESREARGEARFIAGQAMQVGARTVQTARVVKRESPELFERVKRGELALHTAERQIEKQKLEKHRSTAPVRRENITGRQKVRDNAAKERMVSGLSQMRGLARGLLGLKPDSLIRALPSEEVRTWIGMANEIARQLHTFSKALKEGAGHEEA